MCVEVTREGTPEPSIGRARVRQHAGGTQASIALPSAYGDASTAVPGGADRRMRNLLATNDNDVSARRRQSAAHRVTKVERPGALDHGGVLEHDVAAEELAEVADAGTEQHWHLAD